MGYFENGSDLKMDGSTFNDVRGNMHNNNFFFLGKDEDAVGLIASKLESLHLKRQQTIKGEGSGDNRITNRPSDEKNIRLGSATSNQTGHQESVQPDDVVAAIWVLQTAYRTLSSTWEQLTEAKERRAQCNVLLRRIQGLCDVVSQQVRPGCDPAILKSLYRLESTCEAVKLAVQTVSSGPFVWRLLHHDKISSTIQAAEASVIDACAEFDPKSSQFPSMMNEAQQRDKSDFDCHLSSLPKDDKKLLEIFEADSQRRYRLEELIIAFTKCARNIKPANADLDSTKRFICDTAARLQKMSKKPPPVIPSWCLTSLEITFDRDEDLSIGEGRFGRVYRGEWFGQLVAIKEMHPEDASTLGREQIKAISHEVDIWSQLAHPNIVQFYGAGLECRPPFIVSRLCQHGNALDFLRKFPQADRPCMLHEIALGMVYLHTQNIIHADLKALNILIGDDGKAMLADFGLARLQDKIMSNRSSRSKQAVDGTLRWMAPERLDGKPLEKPADVYSFAITAWELFSDGVVPFADIDDRVLPRIVVDKEQRPDRPASMTNNAVWKLVQQCWDPEPSRRPIFPAIHTVLRPMIVQSNSRFSITVSTVDSDPGVTFAPVTSPLEIGDGRKLDVPFEQTNSAPEAIRNKRESSSLTNSRIERVNSRNNRSDGETLTLRQNMEPNLNLQSDVIRHQAKVLYAFVVSANDPNLISLAVGDVVDVLSEEGDWWLVEKQDESRGLVPHNYLQIQPSGGVLSTEKGLHSGRSATPKPNSQANTVSHKAKVLYSRSVASNNTSELSLSRGDILDIVSMEGNWWLARKSNGTTGLAPSNYLQVITPSGGKNPISSFWSRNAGSM